MVCAKMSANILMDKQHTYFVPNAIITVIAIFDYMFGGNMDITLNSSN